MHPLYKKDNWLMNFRSGTGNLNARKRDRRNKLSPSHAIIPWSQCIIMNRFSLYRLLPFSAGLSITFLCIGLSQAHQPPETKAQAKSQGEGKADITKKSDAESKSDDPLARIRDEGLNRSEVMKTALYMTDVIGPRLTNSPGMKRANEWAVKSLKEYGLVNAKLEPWGPFGTGWTLKKFSAQVTDPLCIPLIGIPKAWSPGTNGAVKGEIVHLDATDEKGLEKYKGKLKNAIVLVGSAREVKAHFEPEGVRYTAEQLLAMANAPEPAAGGFRRGGPGGGGPAMKNAGEAAKAEPGKDQPKGKRGGGQGGGGRGQGGGGDQPKSDQAKAEQTKNVINQIRGQASFPSQRIKFLLEEGAAATIEPSFTGDGGTLFVMSASVPQPAPKEGEAPRGFGARVNAYDKNAPATVPQIVVTIEHFNRLAAMLKAGEKLKGEVEIAVEFQKDDLMGYNTVAEIPGTDLKDEVVMLGGHYDSWHGGTGATDNAAGCSVAMEAVRIIQKLGLKPRRTIRIALWSGEEQGLLGSRGYVGQQFGKLQNAGSGMEGMFAGQMNPSAPIIKTAAYDKFQVYFNLDNGTGKIRGVHLQGNENARSTFRKWLHPFADLGANTITANNTGGTDHQSYDAIGLPGFQFIQDEIEYDARTHHSNMDVYDRLQADDLKQASTIMASLVWQAANMNERFPRKPLTRPIMTEEEAKKKSETPEAKKSAAAAN